MSDALQITSNDDCAALPLDFLWLELTNQCNLKCLHCYSESSPRSTERDLLRTDKHLELLAEAFALGCRRVQFIGGEPTLNKSLPSLINHAYHLGYEFIEVFTNLVSVNDDLLDTFVQCRVAVATSVYASTPALHDVVTQTLGSHRRTISNLRRVLTRGLRLRVGVIAMEENKTVIDATIQWLRDLGVTQIGIDPVRHFGRAQKQNPCSMENLCGNCANNILAIGPDGIVAPCIMSKEWAVGSVLSAPLSEIARSEILVRTRRRIKAATVKAQGPYPCQPDSACMPNCNPSYNCIPCAPNGSQPCEPNRWCDPSKR